MSHKTCSKCGLSLPMTAEFFHIDRQKIGTGGLRPDCKPCARKRRHEVYLRRREREIARARQYEKENWARTLERHRKRRQACAEVRAKDRENSRLWRLRNIERARAYDKRWMQDNRGDHVAKAALARARRRKALPSWLTKSQRSEMRTIYRQAAKLKMHVDHKMPIRGVLAWGLHVPWNLQVLPVSDNLRKGNKLVTAP